MNNVEPKKPARSLCLMLVVLAWVLRVAPAAEVAHDFGKWENEIAAFERIDRTNPPPKGAVLFTGSSTI